MYLARWKSLLVCDLFANRPAYAGGNLTWTDLYGNLLFVVLCSRFQAQAVPWEGKSQSTSMTRHYGLGEGLIPNDTAVLKSVSVTEW